MGATRSSTSQIQCSIPITERKDSETEVYVHPEAKPDLLWKLPSEATTLYESFRHSISEYPDNMCLGTRRTDENGNLGEYSWKTYREVDEISGKLGYGLVALGINAKNADGHAFFGVYMKNREAWILFDLACIRQDITTVTIYDTFNEESFLFIIDLTGLTGLVTSNDLASKIFNLKNEGKLSTLKTIILTEEPDEETLKQANSLEITLMSVQQLLTLSETGTDNPPTPDSLFTLCFTSGTTGLPKGVMLTNTNLVNTMGGFYKDYPYYPTDVHLSYLPLAHIFERFVSHYILAVGGATGYFAGNILKLKDDIAALRPTCFVSVPRLYNRFYDAISQQFNSFTGLKKKLVAEALASKLHSYNATGSLTHKLWDKLVFKKVQNGFGGRIRMMISGSAPISPNILAFLKVVFGCPVCNGFGQTETSAPAFVSRIEEYQEAIAGGPIPTLAVKLIAVPEMNYAISDVNEEGQNRPRGEICMKGPDMFIGYYKDPEQTKETIDSEQWVHSGDIGELDPETGRFRVIDRKKAIFKLSQGEFIAPEKIEGIYALSPFIMQIFIYGDSIRNYIVAIIVPDQAFVKGKWAVEQGISPDTSWEEICQMEKLKEDLMKDMKERAVEAKLHGFEQPRDVKIEPNSWTPDNLLTPTQKLMRFPARKQYHEDIERMYAGRE